MSWAIELFLNEAEIASRLTHPNIVQVLDIGEDRGALFLAMEFVHGRDLRTLMRKLRQQRIPMPLGEACHIVREVARALDHAYWSTDMNDKQMAVVHRDVTPHNIMVGFDGVVKLLDFGVAMSAVTEHETMMIVGKWLYMSPEATAQQPLDHRSDLFSLGVVLYFLCAGVTPFVGATPADIVTNIRTGTYPPLSQVMPRTPPRLVALVDRLLSLDPDRRPHRGQEVVRELTTSCVPRLRALDARPRELPREGAARGDHEGPGWTEQQDPGDRTGPVGERSDDARSLADVADAERGARDRSIREPAAARVVPPDRYVGDGTDARGRGTGTGGADAEAEAAVDPPGARGRGRARRRARAAMTLLRVDSRADADVALSVVTTSVTVVWPTASLADIVDLMQASPLVQRVATDESHVDLANAEQFVVTDWSSRQRCITAISAACAAISSELRIAVEQAVDELVMNALYDAPVDERGKKLFAVVPVRRRAAYRTDREVVVRYAVRDGAVTIAVRDTFGSLLRGTLLRHLYKGLHAETPVARGDAGAGVGLYLTLQTASALVYVVEPGVSTEVIARFEPTRERSQLAFEMQSGTGTARPPARMIRVLSEREKLAIASGASVIVLGSVLAATLQTSDLATVRITSTPPGAYATIGGREVGTTPIATVIPGGRVVELELALPGYRVARRRVAVPFGGELAQDVALELAPDRGTVRLISTPPGAAIVRTGERPSKDRTFAPAELVVETGVPQQFTLELPGYEPAVIAPFTVEAGATLERRIELKRR